MIYSFRRVYSLAFGGTFIYLKRGREHVSVRVFPDGTLEEHGFKPEYKEIVNNADIPQEEKEELLAAIDTSDEAVYQGATVSFFVGAEGGEPVGWTLQDPMELRAVAPDVVQEDEDYCVQGVRL